MRPRGGRRRGSPRSGPGPSPAGSRGRAPCRGGDAEAARGRAGGAGRLRAGEGSGASAGREAAAAGKWWLREGRAERGPNAAPAQPEHSPLRAVAAGGAGRGGAGVRTAGRGPAGLRAVRGRAEEAARHGGYGRNGGRRLVPRETSNAGVAK